MSRYNYTAEKSDGEVYKASAEATDRFELYSIVRREGGRIISLDEDRSESKWSWSYWNTKLSSVKEYDKILFARNLGAMIGAGLSLARALAVLERQTKSPKLKSVVGQLASDVRRGDTLHTALGAHGDTFPKLMVAMVRAGEEGGDLSASLATTADQLERMYQLKKKIRGAMLYPCIILVAIFGIGALMMISVVPTLAQTFSELNAELPKSTRFIIGLSDFLVAHTIVALGIVVALVGSIYGGLRTAAGGRAADAVFLSLPAIGEMVREVNAARTARTLASLFSSGVDVLTSLDITREVVQNSYFQEVLKSAQEAVGAGEPLSKTFMSHEKLYPAFVGEMMAVGEETGQTAEMLKRLAAYYEDEVDRKTKDMSTIIEPFLMVFIGGAVGFFAVSMIAPIYQLSENI
jgi:type IV pilus assembly protein PilC